MTSSPAFLDGTPARPGPSTGHDLVDLLLHAAGETPFRIHLRWHGRGLTLAESARCVGRWARWLGGVGVVPGDRVAVVLRDGAERLHVQLAIQARGAVAVELPAEVRIDHLDAVLADAAPKLVLVDQGHPVGLLAAAFMRAPALFVDRRVRAEVAGASPDLPPGARPRPAGHVAHALRQDGTAQGFALPAGALARGASRWAVAVGLKPDDVVEVAVPFSGLTAQMLHGATLSAGATLVVGGADDATVRVLAEGGRARGPEERRLVVVARGRSLEAYEHPGAGIVACETVDRRRRGSSGWACCGYDLKVVGGRIAYRPAAATSDARADGWLITDDRGTIDADGFLWLDQPLARRAS